LGLLYIVLPLSVFFLLREHKQPAVRLWCIGGLVVGVSLVFLALRPLLEERFSGFFVLTFSNTLLIVGYLTRFQSLRIDIEKPLSKIIFFGAIALYVGMFELARNSGHLVHRMVIAYFSAGLVIFMLATAAYQYEQKFGVKQIRFIWVSYYALALTLLVRSIFLSLGWDEAVTFQNSITNSLIVILGIFTVIYSNVAYVGVMLAKAEKEGIAATKKNEKLLKALHKQTGVIKDLMRVQAFSVVGTYGSAVVHEVLQPLTAMRFALENLKTQVLKGSKDKTTQARIDAVDSSAARVIAVIENLRNFIVEREVQIGSVSLNNIMLEVMEITSSRARKMGVEITLKIEDEISVMADAHQLQRVLFNILNNALDAIERCSNANPNPCVLINARYVQQKNFVLIKVIDSGVGLQSKDQIEIFEWLSTNSNKGMGIGLALSKMLVESWRGSISAYNADPKVDGLSGAVFELKLQSA